jgi:hypothetical protein
MHVVADAWHYQSQYILAAFAEVQIMEIQTLGLMEKKSKLEHGGDFLVPLLYVLEQKCRSQLLETNTIKSLILNIWVVGRCSSSTELITIRTNHFFIETTTHIVQVKPNTLQTHFVCVQFQVTTKNKKHHIERPVKIVICKQASSD